MATNYVFVLSYDFSYYLLRKNNFANSIIIILIIVQPATPKSHIGGSGTVFKIFCRNGIYKAESIKITPATTPILSSLLENNFPLFSDVTIKNGIDQELKSC